MSIPPLSGSKILSALPELSPAVLVGEEKSTDQNLIDQSNLSSRQLRRSLRKSQSFDDFLRKGFGLLDEKFKEMGISGERREVEKQSSTPVLKRQLEPISPSSSIKDSSLINDLKVTHTEDQVSAQVVRNLSSEQLLISPISLQRERAFSIQTEPSTPLTLPPRRSSLKEIESSNKNRAPSQLTKEVKGLKVDSGGEKNKNPTISPKISPHKFIKSLNLSKSHSNQELLASHKKKSEDDLLLKEVDKTLERWPIPYLTSSQSENLLILIFVRLDLMKQTLDKHFEIYEAGLIAQSLQKKLNEILHLQLAASKKEDPLNQFLDYYDTYINIHHHERLDKIIAKRIQQAIGGENKKHVKDIINCLRALRLQSMKGAFLPVENEPSLYFLTLNLKERPIQHEDSVLLSNFFDIHLIQHFSKDLDKCSIQAPKALQLDAQVWTYCKKRCGEILKLDNPNSLTTGELAILKRSELQRIIDEVRSEHSVLLYPIISRMKAALWVFCKYMEPLQTTSLLANKLYQNLNILSDIKKSPNYKSEFSNYLSIFFSIENLSTTIISSKKESQPSLFFLLMIIIGGDRGEKEKSNALQILNLLRYWNEITPEILQLDLCPQPCDPKAKIFSRSYRWTFANSTEKTSPPIHMKEVQRYLFGVEDLPSKTADAPPKMIPQKLMINRKEFSYDELKGPQTFAFPPFYKKLLTQIYRSGFNAGKAPSIIDKEAQLFAQQKTIDPSLLLWFGGPIWGLIAQQLVVSNCPDLVNSDFEIREFKASSTGEYENKGIEIYLTVRNPGYYSGTLKRAFIIYPKIEPNKPYPSSVDKDKPKAVISFEFTGFPDYTNVDEKQLEEQITIALRGDSSGQNFPAYQGLLRFINIEFTKYATKKDEEKIFRALKIPFTYSSDHQILVRSKSPERRSLNSKDECEDDFNQFSFKQESMNSFNRSHSKEEFTPILPSPTQKVTVYGSVKGAKIIALRKEDQENSEIQKMMLPLQLINNDHQISPKEKRPDFEKIKEIEKKAIELEKMAQDVQKMAKEVGKEARRILNQDFENN